ncbi:hypothetical protein MLD38_038627 [Melastoma candidum]|uniref:Uncharacterized protein n=1 Tax=Melastoma candidum TaxID=119954 RepID=A0ACB9L0S4_9MYRT|nr:hypothetical protein MLD38_038627 [Melastoma candidum]
MADDSHARPLAPIQVYPRSDLESAFYPPPVPKPVARRRHASKCLVFFLVTVVVLGGLSLAFALTVFRIKAPEFKLRDAAVNGLRYDHNSTSARVKGTLFGEVTLKNDNFGTFEHGNGTVSVLYGGKDFGAEKVVRKGSIRARETEIAKASIDFVVSGEGEGKNNTLREEISGGIVRIRSNGEVRGKISVLGFVKKNKVGVLDCTISIELSSSRITDLNCK